MGVLFNTRYTLSALTIMTAAVMTGLLAYSIYEHPSAGLHLGIPLAGYILVILLTTGFTLVPNIRPGNHPDPVKDFCQANTFFLRLFSASMLPGAFSASFLTALLVSGKLCTDLDPALLTEVEEQSCFNGAAGAVLSWIPPALALAGTIITVIIVWGVGLPRDAEAWIRAQEIAHASQKRLKNKQDIESGLHQQERTQNTVRELHMPSRNSYDSEATVTPDRSENNSNRDRWVEIRL